MTKIQETDSPYGKSKYPLGYSEEQPEAKTFRPSDHQVPVPQSAQGHDGKMYQQPSKKQCGFFLVIIIIKY